MSNMQRARRNSSADVRWQESAGYTATTLEASLHQAKQDLEQAQKSRLMGSNSAKYQAVSRGIDSVLSALETAFDDKQADTGATKVINSYSELLQACKVYNSKSIDADGNAVARRAHFEKGRNRQNLVSRIEEMAKKDFAQLKIYFDKMPGLPPQDRAKNAQEALAKARTSNFKLKGTWAGQKHLGGAISDLIAVNEGGFEGTSVSGLFKKEEKYTVQSAKQTFLETLSDIAEKIPLKKEHYDLYVKALNKQSDNISDVVTLDNACKQDPEVAKLYESNTAFREFSIVFSDAISGKKTMRAMMAGYTKSDALNEGDTVSFAKFNVACSRLAKLLGQGDKIVNAEMATLEDADGKTVNGFLMQKAEGMEAVNSIKSSRQEAFRTGGEKGVEALRKKITPLFQKSFADLQVLDNIFGQVDRHIGNYFVQEKDGMFTGITGIDNDFAFGQLKLGGRAGDFDDDMSNEEVRQQANIDRDAGKNSIKNVKELAYAADLKGNLTIPHMSDGLANAITNLTRSQLEYAVADVLNAAQIKGVWGRIQQLKTGIERERKNPNSNRILKDDQWNEQTLDDFMKGSYNYLQYFVNGLTNASQAKSEVEKQKQL